MFNSFIRFLRGFLYIQIRSCEKERFLNMCRANNLYLWNVNYRDGSIFAYISVNNYKKTKGICHKCHTTARIKKKKGIPFYIYRYRTRICFFAGILIAIILVNTASTYIWSISFSGNLSYTDDTLFEFLQNSDIHTGIRIKDISCNDIENSIRNEYNDITWVSAQIKGTRLIIHIKENPYTIIDNPPEYEASDIISDKEGTITEIITREGIPLVKAGDIVKNGDILITGKIDIKSEYDEILRTDYTNADGDVYALYQYPYEDILLKKYSTKDYTGKKRNNHYIRLFSKYFETKAIRKLKSCDIIVTQKQLCLSKDLYLPVYYGKITAKEYKYNDRIYTYDEANAVLNNRFENFLSEFDDLGVQITEKDVTIEEYDDCFIAHGSISIVSKIGISTPINIIEEETTANEHN